MTNTLVVLRISLDHTEISHRSHIKLFFQKLFLLQTCLTSNLEIYRRIIDMDKEL